jgi:hypothetical protein
MFTNSYFYIVLSILREMSLRAASTFVITAGISG